VCVLRCHAEATAYQDLIPEWSNMGVKVVQVHSGGAPDDKKYVQVRTEGGSCMFVCLLACLHPCLQPT
jgi:hypothetical protein